MTVLAIIIVATAYLNKENADKKTETEIKTQFIIKQNGTVIDTLNLNKIKALDTEKFNAVLKTNGKKPVEYSYEGIQLKNILKLYNIDITKKELIIITSIDGFSVAYSVKEIVEEGNIFLTFAKEGELRKSRKNGGRGPYQVITVKDQFSNRRCKYATEMDVR